MSDTPRTDAATFTCRGAKFDTKVVKVEFAQGLERELTAVRACFAEASQDNATASARIAELEKLIIDIDRHILATDAELPDLPSWEDLMAAFQKIANPQTFS